MTPTLHASNAVDKKGSKRAGNRSSCAVWHPNVLPIIKCVETETAYYLISNYQPFTLHALMNFSSNILASMEAKLFIIYQLAQVLRYCHSMGISHGALHPLYMYITPELWIRVSSFECPAYIQHAPIRTHPIMRTVIPPMRTYQSPILRASLARETVGAPVVQGTHQQLPISAGFKLISWEEDGVGRCW